MSTVESWPSEGSFLAGSPAPGVRVFVRPTEKFKTTTVEVHAHQPLGPGSARNALLALLLRHGTDRCPDTVAVTRRLEEMYGAALGFDLYKIGERQILTLHLELLQDRFAARGLFGEGLRWLGELLLAPRTSATGGFDARVFETEVASLRRRIAGLASDAGRHATERLVSILCEGEPFALGELGDPEELEGIDPSVMEAHFESWRVRTPLDWYVVGDVEPDEVVEAVASLVPATSDRSSVESFPPPVRPGPRPVRRRREATPFGQGWIAAGLRIPETVDPVGALYADALLAGGPCSRLFRDVRDRDGLAYRVESGLEQIKGLWLFRAGVAPGHENDALALALDAVESLGSDPIPEEELEAARRVFVARARSIEDDPVGLIRSDLLARMAGRPLSVEGSIRRHLELRPEDVRRAASELRLDTVLVLDGAEAVAETESEAEAETESETESEIESEIGVEPGVAMGAAAAGATAAGATAAGVPGADGDATGAEAESGIPACA